jgi:hypothetical protein
MRTLMAFVAIVGCFAAACLSTRAEQPPDVPAKTTAERHAQAAQGQPTAQSSNYRFHNGQWWYWWPATKSWKIWNGSAWLDYRPGQSKLAQSQANPSQGTQTRTFSYDEGGTVPAASDAVAPSYRQNFAGFPDSGGTSPILGSYGFRSAGSKAEGRY